MHHPTKTVFHCLCSYCFELLLSSVFLGCLFLCDCCYPKLEQEVWFWLHSLGVFMQYFKIWHLAFGDFLVLTLYLLFFWNFSFHGSFSLSYSILIPYPEVSHQQESLGREFLSGHCIAFPRSEVLHLFRSCHTPTYQRGGGPLASFNCCDCAACWTPQ